MTKLRASAISLALISTVILSGCVKSEPDIPTFDPMDKVQPQEGWKVEQAIVVSPGKDAPTAHHVQAIASGMHNIDFKAPPKALIPIKPSCKVTPPEISSGRYLILGDGWAKYPLMKNADVPTLMTFDNEALNALGKMQADNFIKNGTRKATFENTLRLPTSGMPIKDVFITETKESIVVALAGGGLYNFHLAPGVQLKGVIVYGGKTSYNEIAGAAVAGVPDGVPVNFISKIHKSTKGCWNRIQPRPDKSWRRSLQNKARYNAVMPYWKTFFKRVKTDIDYIPEKNVISVARAGHYLIGPPPQRYEDRIPYIAFAGKTIQYSEAENINFGTAEENRAVAGRLLNSYYEAHLAAATK